MKNPQILLFAPSFLCFLVSCIFEIKWWWTMFSTDLYKVMSVQLKLNSQSIPMEYLPSEICLSSTTLSGLWKGKCVAASLATAWSILSQSWSSGNGSWRTLRFPVGTVRIIFSVASSPQGALLCLTSFFHSSSVVSPGNKDYIPLFPNFKLTVDHTER